MAKFTFLRKTDGWLAAEEDTGQLEGLHTCPAGEGAARSREGGAAAGTGAPGGSSRDGQARLGLSRAPEIPAGLGTSGSKAAQLGTAREGCTEQSSPCDTPRTGQGTAPTLGWGCGSQLPLPGSRGAGRVSWKEIQQVCKPAWQAVKILPAFCQLGRKCHTPPSIQAEINRKRFSFPVNIFEISEAFLIPTLKFKKEDWDGLKKWDG